MIPIAGSPIATATYLLRRRSDRTPQLGHMEIAVHPSAAEARIAEYASVQAPSFLAVAPEAV